MRKLIELGYAEGIREKVKISEKALNFHVIITGMSGSGKTKALQNMEKGIADSGGCVVVLNYNATHDYQNCRDESIVHHSVKEKGMPFELLKAIHTRYGKYEEKEDIVESVTNSFCRIEKLGGNQKKVLKKVIEYVLNAPSESGEIQMMEDALVKSTSKDCDDILGRFGKLLNVLKSGEMPVQLEDGKIYDIDFFGFDNSLQWMLAELILAWLWRYAQLSGENKKRGIFVICDEFQNLAHEKGSILAQILREGRRCKLFLLLATQTLAGVERCDRIILNQVGTKLFFRPVEEEVRQVAKLVDSQHIDELCKLLRELQIGECLTIGKLCVGTVLVDRALKISFR